MDKLIKVVYNSCFGGFGLSRKAAERLAQLGVSEMDEQIEEFKKSPSFFEDCFRLPDNMDRHDPRLVQVVEELKEQASGAFAALKIAELSGNKYIIDDYDGNESIQEPDEIDWIIVE